jgi:hypothetical protein
MMKKDSNISEEKSSTLSVPSTELMKQSSLSSFREDMLSWYTANFKCKNVSWKPNNFWTHFGKRKSITEATQPQAGPSSFWQTP